MCDLETLRNGLHANSVCETEDGTPLPVEVVRRLACEADIIPVVLGSHGEALAVGRTQRLATPAQRAALRAMHRTCVGVTCTVPFDACQIHDVIPWVDGLTIGHFQGGLFLEQLLGRPGIEFDSMKYEFIGAPVNDNRACAFTKASGITSVDQWLAAKSPVVISA